MRIVVLFLAGVFSLATFGFDYEGHRLVNLLAVEGLGGSFPEFVKVAEARERIAYLGGEPDRWRNTDELSLRHLNEPDHYFDFEDLEALGLKAEGLSRFRYEFVAQVSRGRAAHPERFPDDPRDTARVRWLPGFLPWMIAEQYGKLESGFSAWKVFREFGTAEELTNCERNIVYIMGTMGHYVADAAQPLHTTRSFDGWVGANPEGFLTNRNFFHAWIDGKFLRKVEEPSVEELRGRLRPAQALWSSSRGTNSAVFDEVMKYLLAQHRLVEPLYRIEKAGKLAEGAGRDGEGREFILKQLTVGAQMLSDLWQTAWEQAPVDVFLKSALAERKLRQGEIKTSR